MKNIILITLSFLFFSCNSSNKKVEPWTEEDKDIVFRECINYSLDRFMELDEANNKYNADDITAYNIFGQLGFGRFVLEGEYMTGKVSGPGHDHKGYSIQGSYAISNAPAGSWELVYRYSTVENAEGLVSAKEIVRRANIAESEIDEIDQHYIGVNYLFNGHDAKLMLGYEMNDLMDSDGDSTWNGNSSSADGLRARVQFLF